MAKVRTTETTHCEPPHQDDKLLHIGSQQDADEIRSYFFQFSPDAAELTHEELERVTYQFLESAKQGLIKPPKPTNRVR